jgi:hypothetical protein
LKARPQKSKCKRGFSAFGLPQPELDKFSAQWESRLKQISRIEENPMNWIVRILGGKKW